MVYWRKMRYESHVSFGWGFCMLPLCLHVRRGDVTLGPGGVDHPDPARALSVGLGHRHCLARRAWQLAGVGPLKVVQARRRLGLNIETYGEEARGGGINGIRARR